ncbi:MAG: hypothetical protein Q8L90_10135 [Bacteroidota bacterium]|nr:hypothetical protein [Bacteroidota bacterium]
MKKVVLSALVCVSIFACKKEETPVTPVITGPTKHCTATVNGSAFSANSYGSGSINTSYSVSSNSTGGSYIQLGGTMGQTGTHPLSGFPNLFSGTYRINNVTYTSKSGSVNITKCDTLNGFLKHFTATFNFNTDTIAGTSYQITSGDIDYFN